MELSNRKKELETRSQKKVTPTKKITLEYEDSKVFCKILATFKLPNGNLIVFMFSSGLP
jgi:hypothetical protein